VAELRIKFVKFLFCHSGQRGPHVSGYAVAADEAPEGLFADLADGYFHGNTFPDFMFRTRIYKKIGIKHVKNTILPINIQDNEKLYHLFLILNILKRQK